mgnify:CR=1 FL=1
MKKLCYLGAVLCAVFAFDANAQTMSEDFESWGVGTYMGNNSAQWTTWSGTTGGAEDCQVNSSQAASGSNSVYFNSTAQVGGPQDVVVDFGGQHEEGQFNWDANFYVVNGTGAYFNFQGETTPGNLWTLNCQMDQNGNIRFDDGVVIWATTTFTHNTWFNIEIDVDLNTNSWECFVDGNSVGMFQNSNNQLATLDLYPVNNSDNGGNNLSTFYVDDMNFNYTSFALPAENASAYYIDKVLGVAGGEKYPVVTIKNLGTNAITSFDLEVDYDGNQITENITGVNIPSGQTYDVAFTNFITLVAGPNNVTATVSNVNGNGADDNPADDSKYVTVDPIVPAPGKIVVGEEGTGTWCQWCPRGAVFMDFMEETYAGFWAGAAVHNGGNDPMVNATYDAGIGALIGGYPSGLVDRGPEVDPSGFPQDFETRIVIPPNGSMLNGAVYNSGTGELDVSVTTEFLATVSGNWKVAVVITEDGLSGTTSGWAQSNAYAGGANGEMGGYELLPNPVPASLMVYDHVARDIQPSFGGEPNAFPDMSMGAVYTNNYTFQIDPGWDLDSMHIISMLIAPNGEIDNAGYCTVAEAEANGWVEEVDPNASIADYDEVKIDLYPNPATENTNIFIHGLNNDEVIVQVYDLNGKLIATTNHGIMNGEAVLPVETSGFEAGIYTIQTYVGENYKIDKLVVK